MIIGVAKESLPGEKRVAVVPETVKKLKDKGFTVVVQKGAGNDSFFSDDEYKAMGAEIVDSFSQLASKADILVKVRHPANDEPSALKSGSMLFAILDPLYQKDLLATYKEKQITAYAMEFIPRITLAQSMDVLSSMATVTGYRSVLLAANHFGKFFPMLMTAAGTIPPARVLILGAGVAGLQAIATAKRLGAVVEVFDVRPAVKEQVESLGAKFVEMEITEDLQDDQGYAKEASQDFIKKQMELIDKHLSKSDICITTAQIFGKKSPILIKDYMVKNMKPGSVIVDLAAETGGNCELTKYGEIVEVNDVKIIGPDNLASEMATHASKMYSKNVENLLVYLYRNGEILSDEKDEIVARTRITRSGELVSPIIKFTLGI